MITERIDVLLTKYNFAESREKAKRLVMAGVVFVNGQRIDKPGTRVSVDCDIKVKNNPIPYVGRGGLKLEKALSEFQIKLENKVALDIGASTGGFTDCMLKNGIKRVYAIDVGYGQLAWKLRNDDKVICMERTNIRYVKKSDIGELADFASIDVSFISLKLVLPVVKELLNDNGEIVSLIKPQFEAGKEKVGKKGVIKDINVHREVLINFVNFCKSIDLNVIGLTFSPIKGAEGNIEYLAYIKKNNIDYFKYDNEELINNVVKRSHKEL